MKNLKSSLKLYAVTDRYWLNGRLLKDDVEKAILGGATMIQLREKELDKESFIKEALEIKEICKKYDVPFIINDSLDVFLAVDADGLHVGQDDLRADIAREKIGPNKILGVSCETVEEAVLAEKMGADYLGVGTIFNTSTKLDAKSVSIKTLTSICDSTKIPVVAIGGITKDNICELRDTMIDGISVVSAIFKENDIVKATKELVKRVDEILLNTNNYKLFIVDYDGTLLESMSMWDDITSRYLKSKGIIPPKSIDYDVRLQTNDETAEYLKNLFFKDSNVKDVMDDLNKFIMNEYVKIELNEGAKDFLIDLNKKGLVVLYTATTSKLIEASLEKNGIKDLFKHLYTSSTYNVTKVNGMGYIDIAKNLGFNPNETLIVEDAPHALVGAHMSGIKVLGVKGSSNFRHYDDIVRLNCDYYINLRRY